MGKLKGSTFPPQNNKLDVCIRGRFILCPHEPRKTIYIFNLPFPSEAKKGALEQIKRTLSNARFVEALRIGSRIILKKN